MRYLKATSSLGIVYRPSSQIDLVAYSDANWNRESDHKGITGYCLFLNQSPIVWSSKKQEIIATSTMEAEYIAAYHATLKVMAMQQRLKEIGINIELPIILFCDNEPAIALATNPMSSQRSDHIDRKYHKIREQVDNGLIVIEQVSSSQQLADIFTKPLANEPFKSNRNALLE